MSEKKTKKNQKLPGERVVGGPPSFNRAARGENVHTLPDGPKH